MGNRELIALLNSSSWCLVMVVCLLLAVPWGCRRFVVVVFPDHSHLLFLSLAFPPPINWLISIIHSQRHWMIRSKGSFCDISKAFVSV